MEQSKKFISPGAWFSMTYPADWNEFEDGEGSFLFYNPNEWTGNFRISAFKGNATYGKDSIKQELKENPSATPVRIGRLECAYSKEMFEEEGVYYTSHLWITGMDEVAFECSFTVKKGEPAVEAEKIIASLETRKEGVKYPAEIIPVRLSEIYQINEAYEWVDTTVKELLKKDFQGAEEDIAKMQQMMEEKYMGAAEHKRKFSVSMQHYSFAVEAFIKLARNFSLDEYELAVHETKTGEVIENVKNFRSELGILYLNSFNQKAMQKVFDANELEFKPLFDCAVYVYLASGHPLAGKESISFSDLEPYPCLSFEQGNKNSFYFAEEVLSNLEYKQTIKADDRATMLNLMTGLNGYTLCSGIICEELNGDGYTAVPFAAEETMTIGYLKRKGIPLSHLGSRYIEILKQYEKHCK
mgnify:CR=1 FL=1